VKIGFMTTLSGGAAAVGNDKPSASEAPRLHHAARRRGGMAGRGGRTTTSKIAPYWRPGVCVASASNTPKALEAMGKNPKTNRREAVENLVTAAGGKLVAMYGTIADGPGAMVIFEADPAVAPAIAGVAASSDGVTNVKYQRLFSGDEVRAIRQKRVELQKSYRPPGK
jgi:uncharacterized protein with GYD domain